VKVADVVGKAVFIGIADLIGMRPVMGQTHRRLAIFLRRLLVRSLASDLTAGTPCPHGSDL
jgi:hypothetical protein